MRLFSVFHCGNTSRHIYILIPNYFFKVDLSHNIAAFLWLLIVLPNWFPENLYQYKFSSQILFKLIFIRSFVIFLKSCIKLHLPFFLWQSSYPMRVNRCKEILNKAIKMKKSLEKFVGDATRLTDKLLELCNKPVLS